MAFEYHMGSNAWMSRHETWGCIEGITCRNTVYRKIQCRLILASLFHSVAAGLQCQTQQCCIGWQFLEANFVNNYSSCIIWTNVELRLHPFVNITNFSKDIFSSTLTITTPEIVC